MLSFFTSLISVGCYRVKTPALSPSTLVTLCMTSQIVCPCALVCDHVHLCAHVQECVDVWAYMYACVYPPPFTSLLETFWRQEAGYPYAALQGFPPKLASQRGPGMGLEIQPGHRQPKPRVPNMCLGWSLQSRRRIFIIDPPRGGTFCKLLGQRERSSSSASGCNTCVGREEIAHTSKSAPGETPVHWAHLAR